MTLADLVGYAFVAAFAWFVVWLVWNRETRHILIMLVLSIAGAAFLLWAIIEGDKVRLW